MMDIIIDILIAIGIVSASLAAVGMLVAAIIWLAIKVSN